ncbi:helix-turn-helix domain-containing protein [Paenibacillus thiaminolyticus]|uniref:helix-turn-helix domain-containing protein n=1 Tax=Paenibacillus thiaminolyticus TaxID=49283 RepID=UPI002543DC65|nr:helix-turn-helix domain-containing protein [Paenibacillus thiaminolyticus]WII37633.1 helix-turn-helix domain-containing protein [Paenibacillus thiaminolyticus]
MNSVNLVFLTLGELLQRYRQERGMTQVQLAELSGVSRGNISKIENGVIQRPDYKTIQPLISVLEIPLEELLELLAFAKPQSDTLLALLHDSFSYQNAPLSAKIASYLLLESEDENSDVITEKILLTAEQFPDNTEIKLALLDMVIAYSRSHRMQPQLAQGLLQKYLIERDDFSKLEETFRSGKSILNYAEFLSIENRITLYYKLGVHAYHLRRYPECIELSKRIVIEDETESSFKAYSTLLICSSYFYQEKYELAEKYLRSFSLFKFPFVKENVDFMKAKLNQRRGNNKLAIAQLQQCLQISSYKINIVNLLLTVYFSESDFDSIEKLLQRESDFISSDLSNPLVKTEHAYYYMNKGKYLNAIGLQNEAIAYLIKSVSILHELSEEDEELICRIENARIKMEKAVQERKNLTDADVVNLSQELDDYLVEIQKKGLIKRVLWLS